jgi:filamentous hemagglutinin family protein
MLKVDSFSAYLHSFVFTGVLLNVVMSPVWGQVIPDDTLGSERSQVRQESIRGVESDRISGGARRGSNLFHSFTQFNLSERRGAYFENPAGIQNIFSRVIGSDVSTVNGTLGVLGSANLFLLNPNGIVFGRNARLDLGGSFTATTADAIVFGAQGQFTVSEPTLPALLHISPSAFLFNSTLVNGIEVRANLGVPVGQNLTLLGGDVTIAGDRPKDPLQAQRSGYQEGGYLKAPGGLIAIGGLGQPGEVEIRSDQGLRYPENSNFSTVILRNAAFLEVASSDRVEGRVSINARSLELSGGSIILAGILPSASESFGLRESSSIGNIAIDVTGMTSLQSSKIQNLIPDGASGSSGDIRLSTGSLVMSEGSELNTSLSGRGSTGGIYIDADDRVALDRSNIFNSVALSGDGTAGHIRIQADSIQLTNESQIFTASSGSTRQVGNIRIEAQRLVSSRNRSSVNASSFGIGDAGDVVIRSQDGVVLDRESKVFSSASSGTAGNIRIRTNSLTITGGTEVNSSHSGNGDAGNIVIRAQDSVVLSGGSLFYGGAFNGTAGNIDIKADSLTITGGTELNPSASNQGNSGNVVLNIRDGVTLSGGSAIRTGVAEGATGNGGNIEINADSLELIESSEIGANALGNADAGTVQITLQGQLEANNGSITTETRTTSGGNIMIVANSIRLFRNSDIRTNVRDAQRRGGDIRLTANSIAAFDDSDIESSAGIGGNISLGTRGFFGEIYGRSLEVTSPSTDKNSRVDIVADGVDRAGTITRPDISFIENSLTQLPENNLSIDSVLANSCITRNQNDGRFVVIGTDGLPERPGNATLSTYSTGTIQTLSTSEGSSPELSSRPWQMGDPIIEPQGLHWAANRRLAMGQDCR